MKDFNDIERNDDLSQLFRDSAENLEANPSYTAWDKLERKLDSRRLRKRAVIYRYTSMVAAAVGVVALLMVFKLLNRVESLDLTSDNTFTPIAQLEEAPLTEDERRIAEAIQQHKKEAEQVEELKKVIPKTSNESVEEEEIEVDDEVNEPIASNQRDNSISPTPAKPIAAQTIQDNKSREVDKESLGKKDKGVVYVDADSDEAVEEEEVTKIESVAVGDYTFPEKEASNNRMNSSGNPIPNKKQEEAVTKPSRGDENIVIVATEKKKINTTLQTTMESDVKEVSTYGRKQKQKPPKLTLSQFNWIAGKWKDALKTESYEEWFLDEKEIVGEGYVIVNGEKEFSEYMRIYKSGKNIYFESSVDESKKIRKFKLKSYEGNQATFERKSRKFPNKVIITQVSNGAFRITYMNKNDNGISKSQAKYFNTRNNISVERASRSMNRY